MNADRGFTLVELAMVMAIVAITLSYSIPYARSWIANTKIRSAADSLQNGLRFTQLEAAKRNQNVEFVLTTSVPIASNVGSLVASNSGSNWVARVDTSATNTPSYVFLRGQSGSESAKGISVTLTGGGASYVSPIIFTALGRVSGVTSQIQIDFDDASLTDDRPLRVIISPAGRVKMCDPSKPAGNAQACT